MAQVPYSDGVPSVAPDARPPDDYQRINATPDQFGGLIAKGLEQGGQGIQKAAENVFDIAQFRGKVNVADQVNGFITAHNSLLYGDPTKPKTGPDGAPVLGPDGKPAPDTGYMGLEGRAASDQREDTLKQLNDAREAGRKNLKSPQELQEYDFQTRRMYATAQERMGVHADGQWKNWAGGVNQSAALHSLNGFTNSLDNPEAMAHHASDYINFKVQNAQIKYGDDPTIKREVIDDAKRDLLKAQTDAVAVKDPAGALRILEKNKEIAGTQYDDMYTKLRTRAADQTGHEIAATAIVKTTSGALPVQVSTSVADVAQRYGINPGMLERTVQIESGGNPRAQTGSYYGLTQLSKSEFEKYKPRADADIWNPADNLAAGAAKMRAEGGQFAKNFGRAPSGFDSHMIHQQGLAGYSMHLANPNAPAWQNMAATGEGKTKGAGWAKQAIWGNIPDQYKASFGSVDNVTSRDFINMWAAKFGGGAAPSFAQTGGINVGSATGAPLIASQAPAPQLHDVFPTPVAWNFPAEEGLHGGQGRGAFEQAAFPVPNVAATIKPNVIQEILDDPRAQADPQVMTRALRDAHETLDARAIAENQSTKAKKEQSDQAAGGYITKMWDMVHAGGDFVALAGQINHDPTLTWEVKNSLMEHVKKLSGEEQALAFGPGYMQARQALFSSPDTPGHINDFSQLVTRNDITTAGLADLNTRFRLTKSDVDHAATERRINSFLTGAKKDLSFEEDNGFIKIRDPKGEQIYNYQFVPDFVKRASELAEEAQKTGNHDKLDKFLSVENVKNMIRQYRNPQQMAADRMAATGQSAAAPEQPNAPLPPTPEGLSPEGWVPVVSKPPMLSTGQPATHAQWAQALQVLADNPTPQVQQQFDKWFGAAGYKASDVLGKLKRGREAEGEAAGETAPPKAPENKKTLFERYDEEMKALPDIAAHGAGGHSERPLLK